MAEVQTGLPAIARHVDVRALLLDLVSLATHDAKYLLLKFVRKGQKAVLKNMLSSNSNEELYS